MQTVTYNDRVSKLKHTMTGTNLLRVSWSAVTWSCSNLFKYVTHTTAPATVVNNNQIKKLYNFLKYFYYHLTTIDICLLAYVGDGLSLHFEVTHPHAMSLVKEGQLVRLCVLTHRSIQPALTLCGRGVVSFIVWLCICCY